MTLQAASEDAVSRQRVDGRLRPKFEGNRKRALIGDEPSTNARGGHGRAGSKAERARRQNKITGLKRAGKKE